MKAKAKKLNKIKQPDYLLFIICVSLVLFILGIIGWLILGAKHVEQTFRERVVMHVYLVEGVNYEMERDGLIDQLKKLRAVKKITYKNKEYALKEWKKLGGEEFFPITNENILPESLEISFNNNFINPSDINTIKNVLSQNSIVADVEYPFEIFSQFKLLKQVTFYLSLVVIFLLIVAIVILSYLVKLIVYNNRFIIRTMSLVGASSTFISQPFERRAIFNGLISAFLAIGGIFFATRFTVQKIPDLRLIYDKSNFLIICLVILVLGIFISWISTRFTVRKYLNAAALEKFY